VGGYFLVTEKMDKINREQRRILVLAEREGQWIASMTFELLGAGRKIASDLKAILSIALLGHEISDITNKTAQFADEVYSLDHSLLANFEPDLYASALKQLCQKVNPDAVLMGYTLNNLNLAPRLAYRMGVEVITDRVDLVIEPETGYLLCTKPVYGAKVLSTFKLGKKPYMVTLRPKAFEVSRLESDRGKIIHFNPVIDESLVKIEMIEKIKEESVSLNKAEAIVAGGRGIKDAEGLERLKGLIKVLRKYFNKVELGASRPLVDARLVPSSRQIGLTGQKVAPELYIAVGISGSLQHLTGILGAKKIIAINTDPKAHIFKVADYGVIGSFEEVVPAFKKKLEELE
jgi:electron transfer flavoprotein alpha subunit